MRSIIFSLSYLLQLRKHKLPKIFLYLYLLFVIILCTNSLHLDARIQKLFYLFFNRYDTMLKVSASKRDERLNNQNY